MADKAKSGNPVITRDFTSEDVKDPEKARKMFQDMVLDLGRHKFYNNTEYIDLFGKPTTVTKELADIREIYSTAESEDVRALATLPDALLLQKLRERASAQVRLLDKEDMELLVRRQKAIDQDTGS